MRKQMVILDTDAYDEVVGILTFHMQDLDEIHKEIDRVRSEVDGWTIQDIIDALVTKFDVRWDEDVFSIGI